MEDARRRTTDSEIANEWTRKSEERRLPRKSKTENRKRLTDNPDIVGPRNTQKSENGEVARVPSEATSAIGANEREWALIRQCSRDGYGAGK